jgi:tRNA modification GTPase
LHYRSDDTIAALATPPGRGAVAIVRLSGPKALAIGRELTGIDPRPRVAHVCEFRDENGEQLDQGLLLYFPAPRSFTGEDVVELHGHGGLVVSDWLLDSAYRLGSRPAEPGEFALRAFLNDKLDLTQAEAIADLVDSGSRQAARAAARSLDGRFSDRVRALQATLTELRAQLEAWLDFPEEELELDDTSELAARFDFALSQLEMMRSQAREGAVLRDGLSVVIAGLPNAGKSSLMNRMAGYDAAIVTRLPGTTRDALRESLSLDGLPVTITDTAGLRASADPAEAEGVRRAQKAAQTADRILWVTDIQSDLRRSLGEQRAEVGEQATVTVIQNKVDLVPEAAARFELDGVPVIRLSALTGEGIELLTEHLKAVAGYRGEVAGTFSARSRHLDALKGAENYVRDARAQLLDASALELAAEELRSAQTALSELTGELTSDDLLGEIFSSFCIGK